MEGLELEIGIYDSLKPLSETIAQSVDGFEAKRFLDGLLMQAYLATHNGKTTAHELELPKQQLRQDIDYLIEGDYDSLAFHELKETDAQRYYLIIRSLWYIKSHKEINKILRGEND